MLNRLFQRTFAVAKDVRTQTDIGSASISMAAAAVKLAERIFPSHREPAAAADRRRRDDRARGDAFRRARSRKSITVANRTLERGEQLADRFGAEAITLNELPERLHEFDIVVTCTASTLPIIGKGLLERVVKQRRHAPMFIVDLGRAARRRAGGRRELDDVFLYSVDDLAEIVKDNLQIRREAVVQAEQMIAEQTDAFPALARRAHRRADDRRAAPSITTRFAQAELERARRMLAGGAPPEQVLDALARGLTNKLLHAPLAGAQCRGRSRARRADRAARSASTTSRRADSGEP